MTPTVALCPHAQDALRERNIPEGWVWATLSAPDCTERSADRRAHYWRRVMTAEGKERWLHVVAAPRGRVITVYLDHRGRKWGAPGIGP